MGKAILDADTGSRRLTIYHEDGNKRHIETRQDVTHIAEAAKILADDTPSKDFRLAALIPEEVLNKAMLEGWFHDKQAWKKWANDPANAHFRVWNGRL